MILCRHHCFSVSLCLDTKKKVRHCRNHDIDLANSYFNFKSFNCYMDVTSLQKNL